MLRRFLEKLGFARKKGSYNANNYKSKEDKRIKKVLKRTQSMSLSINNLADAVIFQDDSRPIVHQRKHVQERALQSQPALEPVHVNHKNNKDVIYKPKLLPPKPVEPESLPYFESYDSDHESESSFKSCLSYEAAEALRLASKSEEYKNSLQNLVNSLDEEDNHEEDLYEPVRPNESFYEDINYAAERAQIENDSKQRVVGNAEISSNAELGVDAGTQAKLESVVGDTTSVLYDYPHLLSYYMESRGMNPEQNIYSVVKYENKSYKKRPTPDDANDPDTISEKNSNSVPENDFQRKSTMNGLHHELVEQNSNIKIQSSSFDDDDYYIWGDSPAVQSYPQEEIEPEQYSDPEYQKQTVDLQAGSLASTKLDTYKDCFQNQGQAKEISQSNEPCTSLSENSSEQNGKSNITYEYQHVVNIVESSPTDTNTQLQKLLRIDAPTELLEQSATDVEKKSLNPETEHATNIWAKQMPTSESENVIEIDGISNPYYSTIHAGVKIDSEYLRDSEQNWGPLSTVEEESEDFEENKSQKRDANTTTLDSEDLREFSEDDFEDLPEEKHHFRPKSVNIQSEDADWNPQEIIFSSSNDNPVYFYGLPSLEDTNNQSNKEAAVADPLKHDENRDIEKYMTNVEEENTNSVQIERSILEKFKRNTIQGEEKAVVFEELLDINQQIDTIRDEINSKLNDSNKGPLLLQLAQEMKKLVTMDISRADEDILDYQDSTLKRIRSCIRRVKG